MGYGGNKCPQGHVLEARLVSGGILGVGMKSCRLCGRQLQAGMPRHSCKICGFHVCNQCWCRVAGGEAAFVRELPSAEMVRRRSTKRHTIQNVGGVPSSRRAGRSLSLTKIAKDDSIAARKLLAPSVIALPLETVKKTDFSSIWEIFQTYDRTNSGHLSRVDFKRAVGACQRMRSSEDVVTINSEEAWNQSGGANTGFVNFPQFSSWVDKLGLNIPIGFKIDIARTESEFASTIGLARLGWAPDLHGLVEILDPDILASLQGMLTHTHKTTDNWTRDRGCWIHGLNRCTDACLYRHRQRVPTGYTLVAAFRNQNLQLWNRYCLFRQAVVEECLRDSTVEFEEVDVDTSKPSSLLQDNLDSQCNEWRLFHGSTVENCQTICAYNFSLSHSGKGATWKNPGESKGQPLYGYGIYFAEKITKADEYAREVPEGFAEEGLHCVILCRVVGGRCNVVTGNQIEVDQLRKNVFEGPHHSILGDRVSTLGKPYREVIVYEEDQCYPEYMIVYAHRYSE